ncbi:hypothetical protein ACW9KT_15595 [Hymenobacter sp. HD11105]
MAKTNIKGKDVGIYLEKTAGSGTYTRIRCADDVSVDVNTEEIEVSTCDDSDEETGVSFKQFEPGAVDWTGAINGAMRQITGADADANISSENLLDMQLGGRKLLLRFTLGTVEGSARYSGRIFFTKNGLSGTTKEIGKFATTFRGDGPLTKSLVPAG